MGYITIINFKRDFMQLFRNYKFTLSSWWKEISQFFFIPQN